jgi:hypothetical protein
MDRLSRMKQLKNGPVHKEIMHTKDAFVDNDHFHHSEEAIQAAVDKRKFLTKKLLKDYTFTEDSDDEYH